MFNLTPVVRILLLINILVQLLNYTGLPIPELLGLRYVLAPEFQPFQFFTYMFAHSDQSWWHLIGNMFALFMFGPMLEQHFGSGRFLAFYLICGIGSGLIYSGIHFYEMQQMFGKVQSYMDSPSPGKLGSFLRTEFPTMFERYREVVIEYKNNPDNPEFAGYGRELVRSLYLLKANMPMVGASGAVFGILMAFGMLFPNVELFLLFLPVPIKAKYFVLFYGAYELYAGINRMPGDNVAHFAHLGGMLFAFILIKLWHRHEDY